VPRTSEERWGSRRGTKTTLRRREDNRDISATSGVFSKFTPVGFDERRERPSRIGSSFHEFHGRLPVTRLYLPKTSRRKAFKTVQRTNYHHVIWPTNEKMKKHTSIVTKQYLGHDREIHKFKTRNSKAIEENSLFAGVRLFARTIRVYNVRAPEGRYNTLDLSTIWTVSNTLGSDSARRRDYVNSVKSPSRCDWARVSAVVFARAKRFDAITVFRWKPVIVRYTIIIIIIII